MRRTLIAVLLGWFALIVPMASRAVAAPDTVSMEQQFVARINALRTSKGLGALTVDAELTSIARAWSGQMAKAGAISHNPNFGQQVTQDWVKLGENVGVGPDVDSLFNAFVASPHHYANLVDPAFTKVGVGVVVTPDGSLYTSHQFMRLAADDPPPPPPPAPRPKVSRPAAPRVTAPAPAAAPVAAQPAPPAAPAPGPDHVFQSIEQLRGFDR